MIPASRSTLKWWVAVDLLTERSKPPHEMSPSAAASCVTMLRRTGSTSASSIRWSSKSAISGCGGVRDNRAIVRRRPKFDQHQSLTTVVLLANVALMTTTTVRFHQTGGPEVLQLERVEPGAPAAREVL